MLFDAAHETHAVSIRRRHLPTPGPFSQLCSLTWPALITYVYHASLWGDLGIQPNTNCIQRVMINEKPSSQAAVDPESPPIVYPLGGMSVCLVGRQSHPSFHYYSRTTYPLPPVALPNHSLVLPRLVRIWMPSIQSPARRANPRSNSPFRVSSGKSVACPPRLPKTWLVASS